MNVNEIIISALKPFVANVKPHRYEGSEKTYITFNYVDDRGYEFADDEPQTEIASLQIHLFTPNDYMALKKQIRSALFEAGFSYPQINDFYEDDTKLNHIVFECEYVKEREE